ncbi:MAG: hypothetical protein M1833_006138 [Piccolia ochrophora]|nr:MAG: hypothetical protein M1833_006138 [Piccolia ochrophora]
MEVAGFAMGAISAVGLLGQIFDGCVKAYSYFTIANNLGKDSERLLCKIRIEEMRLVVWGREWGVKEGKLEAHLAASYGDGDNDGLKKMAEMILQQLLDTIGNTKKLKDRYGVKEESSTMEEKLVRRKSGPAEANAWDEIRLRAKWVISDKNKFESLLVDLKDYNDGLERLFPPARIATLQRTWTNELLQTAKRDIGQLGLLESASSGVYPHLNASANLKQLRINLDSEEYAKFRPTSALKIPPRSLTIPTNATDKRQVGDYKSRDRDDPSPVLIEWVAYDPEASLDVRLTLLQRVDSLARMVHSASNRHPDLHTLDCLGYIDDTSRKCYGLTYRIPPHISEPTPQTLSSLIDDPQLRTPDLDARFTLAHTLAVALWSFHSLDWLHKTFCSTNILFFPSSTPSPNPSEPTPTLTDPYVTGFDSARPEHLDEMTVASKNDIGQDLYRHPDSLGMWRQSYRKSFDIYSLGLVLLELGLWKSLRPFHRPKYTPAAFRDKAVLPVLVPRLGSKTGKRYQGVVERCLMCEDKEGEGVGRLMEWVVMTLEGLRV